MFTFQVTLRNYSAWPIDIVWENAVDLEHVAFLHRDTNYGFELLDVRPDPRGRFLYDSMTFIAKRKLLGIVPSVNFGHRWIADMYEIWQIDQNPLLGITTCLRSTLEPNPQDPAKTDMVDYVTITAPGLLKPFRRLLEAALRRHTRIQCQQDESFRARRAELRARGINLPPSLFNASLMEQRFAV